MKRLVACLLLFLLLIPTNVCFVSAEAPSTILTIGDSITYGSCSGDTVGSVDNTRTYQAYLKAQLGSSVNIINRGVSGQAVMEDPVYLASGNTNIGYGALKHPYIKSALSLNVDVVIIMLGTNDSKITQGKNIGVWYYQNAQGNDAKFKTMYTELVRAFLNMSCKPDVYLMIPPPALPLGYNGRGDYRISEEILSGKVTPIIRAVAAELNLPLIDLRAAFPNPSTRLGKIDLSYLLMDCVHPNYKGYQLIAETVASRLKKDYQFPENNPTPSPSPAPTPTPTPVATWRVTYDASGGEGVLPKDTKLYESGTSAKLLDGSSLTKEGYTFAGWSKTKNATEADYLAGSYLSISENTTLYAVWEKASIYRVYYHSTVEGIVIAEDTNLYATQDTLTLPEEASLEYDRNAWKFDHWALGEDKVPYDLPIATFALADLHFYAVFSPVEEAPTPAPAPDSEDPTQTPDTPNTPEVGPAPAAPALPSFFVQYLPLILLLVAVLAIPAAILLVLLRRKKNSASQNGVITDESDSNHEG